MSRQLKQVAYHTLGCKLNYAETSTISRAMESAGYATVAFHGRADLYVINTCTVTENADRDFRKMVNRIRRLSPGAQIAAVGCYAQLKPQWISEELQVDYVLGSHEKFDLPIYVTPDPTHPVVAVDSDLEDGHHSFQSAYSLGDRTRTFLKIQDGCDYPCSYCTIPLARGLSRSDSPEKIMSAVHEIVSQGVREIVLTGVNVGDYRYKDYVFTDVLVRILEADGLERVRISSIEPNLLTDEIIQLAKDHPVLLPHFHVPLQSGSDAILKLMQRRYNSAHYRGRIDSIRQMVPFAGIGADVIVGFPGETDDEFEKTYEFIHSLDLSYLHVFTYSERASTHAQKLEGKVPVAIRKERNRRLTILSHKKWRSFAEENLGRRVPVLFESFDSDQMIGLTDNYLRVHVAGGQTSELNSIRQVELTEIRDNYLMGNLS